MYFILGKLLDIGHKKPQPRSISNKPVSIESTSAADILKMVKLLARGGGGVKYEAVED